jgi:mono/diheme cytochrome c family protein
MGGPVFALLGIALMLISCGRKDQHGGEHGEQHGTPKDWKFTLARGDPVEGRKVFVELQCYKCHEVKGEHFADAAETEKGVGPELSQMAGMHPVEFFAESIVNPNAVIDDDAKERGYVGMDGKSKMPDYGDVLTVKQLADLATYLTTLKGQTHKH